MGDHHSIKMNEKNNKNERKKHIRIHKTINKYLRSKTDRQNKMSRATAAGYADTYKLQCRFFLQLILFEELVQCTIFNSSSTFSCECHIKNAKPNLTTLAVFYMHLIFVLCLIFYSICCTNMYNVSTI